MNVIVTGANGFIGREIVSELLENRCFVCGVGTSERAKFPEFDNDADLSTKYVSADITDCKNFNELESLEKVDAVVHSAGLAHQFGAAEKEKFDSVNVRGTKNTTELAVRLKARQFILISSTAIYGLKKNIIDEDSPCQPETIYAESKLEAEKICIEICRENGLPLTVLRLAPVLGEDNVGNAARLVSAIDKRRFVWIGNGENVKTLIYKNDVARAVVKILQSKRDQIEIFNLAAKPISMLEFVREIERHLNKNAPKIHIPSGFLRTLFLLNKKSIGIAKLDRLSKTVEKWMSDDVYSAQKIKEEYDFEPQTSMAEAIERQVRHYLDRKTKG